MEILFPVSMNLCVRIVKYLQKAIHLKFYICINIMPSKFLLEYLHKINTIGDWTINVNTFKDADTYS